MAAAIILDDSSNVFESDTKNYLSLPYLTKYEFDQVIGLRTVQLSNGAPPLVDIPADYTVKMNMQLREIAVQELTENKLAMIIKRTLPNGQVEYWPLAKLGRERVRYLVA